MGLSTIEIMNMLAPDVATLGNHVIPAEIIAIYNEPKPNRKESVAIE